MAQIEKSIFREYDIRGIADGSQLSPEVVELLGKAYGTFLRKRGADKAVVGYDARLTGPAFQAAMINGLLSTGVDVYDIGLTMTPLMYWGQYYFDSPGGVMITASHNPKEWNGFKFAFGKSYTLIGDEVREIQKYTETEEFAQGNGKSDKKDVFPAYKEDVLKRINVTGKRKVVVDCANGSAGLFAPELYRAAGFEVVELFCEPDGNFPNHSPDPAELKFMKILGDKVVETGSDLGLGFDGDGDRLGMVDEKGGIIWPDRYMILLARSVLKKKPGAKIIFDVKCSDALAEDIIAHGGTPIMWKTGHSHIKAKLHEEKAALAGEMSGHIFFMDNWYGFDDSAYSGFRLLEYLAADDRKVSEIIDETPYYVATPTIHVHCGDEVKYKVVDELIKDFKALEGNGEILDVNTVNGARVKMIDGWGLARASSNVPALVLRMEAKTAERLIEIKDYFREMFKKYPEIAEVWENE
ncbi:phosphomannomutase/phosphoglucomutase [bacterium]|nr:phosphomannomutase/phosphoglucomutase [bacterium]